MGHGINIFAPGVAVKHPNFWPVEMDGVADVQRVPGVYDLLSLVHCFEVLLEVCVFIHSSRLEPFAHTQG